MLFGKCGRRLFAFLAAVCLAGLPLCALFAGCGEARQASGAAEDAPTEDGAQDGARQPMIALTFDDGPSEHTERLLDLFAAYGGHGTFCVIGNRIDLLPKTVARAVREGNELAVHSWDHCQLTRLGADKVTEEIESTRQKILELTGKDCTVLRPTYGAVNDTLMRVAKELDMIVVNWSVDTLDWKTRNADTTLRAVLNGAQDGAIILCHDLYGETVDAMERAIPALVARGYRLVTVTELLTADARTVEAGRLYRKQGPKPQAE